MSNGFFRNTESSETSHGQVYIQVPILSDPFRRGLDQVLPVSFYFILLDTSCVWPLESMLFNLHVYTVWICMATRFGSPLWCLQCLQHQNVEGSTWIHHMALIKESHLGTPLSCWMPRMTKQLPWMKGQAGSRLISTDHGGLGWPQMTRNMLMVSSHCVWRCAYESYHVHDLICYIFPILSLISWIRNDSNVCRTIHCGTSASASGAGRWMLWFMILTYIYIYILTLDHTLLPIVLLWFWAAAWNRSEYSIRVRPAEMQCSCPFSVVFRCAMISSV